MPSNSSSTFLMVGSGEPTTYIKLIDIINSPEIGGTREMLDATTLTDKQKKGIPGLEGNDPKEFSVLYEKADYTTLTAYTGTNTPFAIYFGEDAQGDPDGSEGKWGFSGDLSVKIDALEVNKPRTMTITIIPSTAVEVIA